MSVRRWRAALAAVLYCSACAATADAAGLRHDPFTRARLGPAAAASPPSDATAASAEAQAPAWQPELRGVMQAGAASLANVGGSIVGIGESIDGWRLVRVEDGRAVFVKNGKQTLLTMNLAGQPRK